MKVIKRNGKEEDFCLDKIINAVKRANLSVDEKDRINQEQFDKVVDVVQKKLKGFDTISVEDIHDFVENALMLKNHFIVAKSYVIYRNDKKKNKKFSQDEEEILSIIDGENEDAKQNNANKDVNFLGTQRDYIAGTKSKTLVKKTWSKELIEADASGKIHIHDKDYRIQRMTNCCLVNVKDMFEHGFMLNSTMIHKPSGFSTACNLACQIALHVSSSQYGGQTMSWSHIAKYVDSSRKLFDKETREFLQGIEISEEKIQSIIESKVLNEIEKGVKIFQYQTISLSGTNGQSPFISMAINFAECENERHKDDLCLVAKEVFKQRIKGVLDSHGNRVSPLFPKILFFLDDDTMEGGKYYDELMPIICKCENERMSPDFISSKIQKELKGNKIAYPCMGSLSGDALVSIKIGDCEYNDIEIKTAFILIENHIKKNSCEQDYSTESENSLCGVYKLTHLPTGKFYIGSSKDLNRRKSEHFYSLKTKGTLGDNYFIDDFNTDNLTFEVLETCNADNLFEVEYKYTDYKDNDCVNVKDCRRSGNVDFNENAQVKHGRCIPMMNNRGYTYTHDVDTNDVFVKSKNEWTPIRNILKNDPKKSHFEMYKVVFENKEVVKEIICTQDHPLHTQNGRVEAQCLTTDDYLYDSETYEHCRILSVEKINDECVTYDFTVDNDLFDVNGIISHNCRSFLTTEGSYYDSYFGKQMNCNEQFYGRHNNGVITINLPYVALESEKDVNKFWKILDDRLELIYTGFVQTYKRLKGTKAKVAPILWMWGGLTRKKADDTIDDVITGWRSTYSLGYVGLWETSLYMTGKNLVEDKSFALSILDFFNKKHDEWHKRLMDENNPNSFLNTSSYGTPEEQTTTKFANALKKGFGVIENVTDHNYVTNSYHINPAYKIDAFHKLGHESEFLAKSTGGAVSYVEIPDMSENLEAIESIINYMGNTILYSELNIRRDICYICGYRGEIKLTKINGKLIWECPSCKNQNTEDMTILRRACGYIFNANAGVSQGRLGDIQARVLHIGSGRTSDQNGNVIL